MKKKRVIRNIILILLSAVLLYFFFRTVDWKDVSHQIIKINIGLLALLVLTVPVPYIIRVIRWQFLLKYEKPDITFYNRFAAVGVGFMVSQLIPGRVGELIRPLYLAQKENLKKGFVLGTVVVERVFDVFAICLLLGLFLLVKPARFMEGGGGENVYSNLSYWGIGGFVFASAILLVSLGLIFFKGRALLFLSSILRVFPKKISGKILEILEDFIHGLNFFHSWRNVILYFLWSIFLWLWMMFYYWLFFLAFDVRVPYIFLIPYLFVLMVGAAIPTPGMVGGYDWFSKWGLTTFFKIEVNLAVGMTIVFHAVQVVIITLLGFVILWKDGLSWMKLKKIQEMGENEKQR